MSIEFYYWRGRALYQALGSHGMGAKMSMKERKKVKQEIEDIKIKLKVLAKKELKKAGLLNKKGELIQ